MGGVLTIGRSPLAVWLSAREWFRNGTTDTRKIVRALNLNRGKEWLKANNAHFKVWKAFCDMRSMDPVSNDVIATYLEEFLDSCGVSSNTRVTRANSIKAVRKFDDSLSYRKLMAKKWCNRHGLLFDRPEGE